MTVRTAGNIKNCTIDDLTDAIRQRLDNDAFTTMIRRGQYCTHIATATATRRVIYVVLDEIFTDTQERITDAKRHNSMPH